MNEMFNEDNSSTMSDKAPTIRKLLNINEIYKTPSICGKKKDDIDIMNENRKNIRNGKGQPENQHQFKKGKYA